MKKIKGWKHEKEFDTKTLLSDIGPIDTDTSKTGGISAESSADSGNKPRQTRHATDLKTISDAEILSSEDKITQIYEPRPLTPDDDIYEDIIEQFASAPTKPKYWFEEFGDYWSCSCGHINKGARCRSCGLERELLRSLFILHKPAGSPGKLNKKLSKAAKEQADKEEQHHSDKENRRKQREAAGDDCLKVVPIETDESCAAYETDPEDISATHEDAHTPYEERSRVEDTDNARPHNEIRQGGTESVISQGNNKTSPAIHKRIGFKAKIIIAIVACLILIGGCGSVIYYYMAAPAMRYQEAQQLQADGKYEKAIEKYKALGDYKDCEELIWQCYIGLGDQYFEAGEFTEAMDAYNTAMDLKDDESLHDKIWQCYIGIGDQYYESGKFTKAIDTYNTAMELKDDESLNDKIWQCYIGIGDKYLSDKQYEDAIDTYYTAADLKDNEKVQKKINKAKFAYVKKYQSDRTAKVEEYMSDLMAVKYSGIQEIYDKYYAWHVKIVANTSDDDYSNDVSTVSRKDTVYFHATLSGGEPDEQITLYYEVTWPNGSSQIADLGSGWEAGSKITARFQYPIPLFGKEGKFTFTLYDKSTNEKLGSDTVTFEN